MFMGMKSKKSILLTTPRITTWIFKQVIFFLKDHLSQWWYTRFIYFGKESNCAL